MIQMDDATRAQVDAAEPRKSTWVTANAGSGKTRVLTNRVARLLLNGTDPQKILCLTYTKAAAAEMQNRLFEQLGSWSMLANDTLATELSKLGEGSLSTDVLEKARTLFASALETPGGLKIQTIHSFCERVLRRFPMEAAVSPQFQVLEERQARQARLDILDQMALEDGDLVTEFGRYMQDLDPDAFLSELCKHSGRFHPDLPASEFGLTGSETKDQLWRAFLPAEEEAAFKKIMQAAANADGTNDAKAGCAGLNALLEADIDARFAQMQPALLVLKSGHPKYTSQGQFPTNSFKEAHPDLVDDLCRYMDLFSEMSAKKIALEGWQRTHLLNRFGSAFLKRYDHYKAGRACVDFNDMINLTADLLTKQDMAQWVLYKLDGGLDHILVDEAQDTSPEQWDVIRALTAEFTTDPDRTSDRTVFVVGDQKQSIYSFQGADPAAFDDMHTHFRTHLEEHASGLIDARLLYSFRSAPQILELVDHVAKDAEQGLPPSVEHAAYFHKKPGCVDLWPLIEKEPEAEQPPWYEPLNRASEADPKHKLAQQIATYISDVIRSGKELLIRGKMRPVRAGDFLILVQNRQGLSELLIRSLKSAGLPVAGADRLKVNDELAVKDILALLRFMTLPEDDLSLAEALRSPIFGLSEGALFSLAHGRGKRTLWQSLRENMADTETYQQLSYLLKRADFDRPYDLIDLILNKFQGREKLLARLGAESADALDELVAQAMAYEHTEPPTLTGFLAWFDAGVVEVKRQFDTEANLVRVMTVHGAKGLEAPIVILPDTMRTPPKIKSGGVFQSDTGMMVMNAAKPPSEPERLAAEAQKEKETAEKSRQLYVALTRAENWLIVCGYSTKKKKSSEEKKPKETKPSNNWYCQVKHAMHGLSAATDTTCHGVNCLRFAATDWDVQSGQSAATATPEPPVTMPDYATQRPKPQSRPKRPISPSELPGAKALSGDGPADTELAKVKGTALHLLLEKLPRQPKAEWQQIGERALAGVAELSDSLKQELLAQAHALLTDPALKDVFAKNALAEVGVSAPTGNSGAHMIQGSIDRLIVTEKRVTIVDFKNNHTVPKDAQSIPTGILNQMSAYRDAVTRIFPGREIEMKILWTKTHNLMPVPHDIVKDFSELLPDLDPPTAPAYVPNDAF